MTNILVLANETIGGGELLDTVRERARRGRRALLRRRPPTRPRHGNVIYDEAVRDSAQVRVDLALAFMRDEGIDGTGEVGDADPFNAAMDAIARAPHRRGHHLDAAGHVSGWLRRDLIERLETRPGCRSTHVVVDVDSEGLPFDVTLVLANQTAAGGELVQHLEKLADEGPRRFIVVVPQGSGDGRAVRAARERLGQLLESLRSDKHRGRRHDRRPRPLHGGDERPPVLPHLGGRDLDAALQPLRSGSRRA